MTRGGARVLWRTLTEVLLALYAGGWALALGARSLWGLALAVLGVAACGVALALRVKVARGTLRLAWSAPLVDALGLPTPLSEDAWRAVAAAETVLTALSGEARAYRDFLPDARGDVRTALARALKPQARREEVEAVVRRLEQISRCLSTAQIPSEPSGGEALEGLALRAEALAEAVSELAPLARVVPLTRGVRS